MRSTTIVRRIIAGMAGGLAGVFLMYLFGAGIFTIMGWPANTSVMIIGDSAAAFFSKLGLRITGGVSLGIPLYCLIGLGMGAIFGAGVVKLGLFRQASLLKRIGLGILYVELLSLPLLAAGALSLGMSAAIAALWFSISAVMHLVYGLVLGAVTSWGVGRAARDQ